jgi:hypothetical protein
MAQRNLGLSQARLAGPEDPHASPPKYSHKSGKNLIAELINNLES